MSTERDNLEIHVDLCTERYKQLEYRLTIVETKLTEFNQDLNQFKTEVRESFAEIKNMINQSHTDRFRTMVTTTGTVIVGLLGLLGYIVINLK